MNKTQVCEMPPRLRCEMREIADSAGGPPWVDPVRRIYRLSEFEREHPDAALVEALISQALVADPPEMFPRPEGPFDVAELIGQAGARTDRARMLDEITGDDQMTSHR